MTYLWEKGKTPNYDGRDPRQPEPSIVFVPAQGSEKKQGTVIVAHGGGFEIRTGCEGMNVAEYFSRNGFNTAILTYRLRPYGRMDALDDIKRAIRLLRAKKEEFGITGKIVDIKDEKIVIETGEDQVRMELQKWAVMTNETAEKEKSKRAEEAKQAAQKAKEEKAKAKADKKSGTN